jgi:threonine dehydratase
MLTRADPYHGASVSERPSVTDVAVAAGRLRGTTLRTPLEPCERLSRDVGVPVLLKREDLQICRSYKIRGAYNLISSLDATERERGVVCASAGNHAQGVAFSCGTLKIAGRIYLPDNTPKQKLDRILAIGGRWIEPVIVGRYFDQADDAARRHHELTGAVYVHPFDDLRTVAGQATVAAEIDSQLPCPIDTVIVPVGGGGLIAGILVWLKEHRPNIRVVGVEPEGAASMAAAISHGGPSALSSVDTFVDGAAVRCVGKIGFGVVRDLVDDLVTVPNGAVCLEMVDLYQADGIIAEPAGALATAAARVALRSKPRGPVVCIVSGGNNDIDRYGDVLRQAREHGARPRPDRTGPRADGPP